jgi:hypothetical protein
MSPAMRGRRWGAVATRSSVVLALMAAPTAALAHPRGGLLTSATVAPTHHHAGELLASVTTGVPAAWLGALFVAAAGLGLAWALRRRQHAWPVALAIVVASGAFETGLHGVHHLADPAGSAKCTGAVASAHSEGISAEDRPIPAPEFVLHGAVPAYADALLLPSLHSLPEGRAPPLRAST